MTSPTFMAQTQLGLLDGFWGRCLFFTLLPRGEEKTGLFFVKGAISFLDSGSPSAFAGVVRIEDPSPPR